MGGRSLTEGDQGEGGHLYYIEGDRGGGGGTYRG